MYQGVSTIKYWKIQFRKRSIIGFPSSIDNKVPLYRVSHMVNVMHAPSPLGILALTFSGKRESMCRHLEHMI